MSIARRVSGLHLDVLFCVLCRGETCHGDGAVCVDDRESRNPKYIEGDHHNEDVVVHNMPAASRCMHRQSLLLSCMNYASCGNSYGSS